MATSAAAIPRFLLPQTTWKALAPKNSTSTQPFIVRPQSASPPLRRPFSSQPQRFHPPTIQTVCSPLRHHFSATFLIPSSHRTFATTPSRPRDHHFDTLKFTQRLHSEGFSPSQSEALMRILSDVIEESIQNLTRTMVLREDADRSTYTQKVDFTKLRSELLAQDSSESNQTLAAYERLEAEFKKLEQRVRDEVGRAQASVKLDLNLEKGRVREEVKGQESKLRETETRIDEVAASLKERVEGVKYSTLQWLLGVVTGTAAIILGVWRLLM